MKRNEVLNYNNSPNGTKDQLINACIQAGFAFFTTLAGVAVAQIRTEPLTFLFAGSISAGVAFFSSLMLQRGLKKHKGD